MDNDKGTTNDQSATFRDLGGRLRTRRYPPVVNRWALIVGISRYKHSEWDLKFADRDAAKLMEFIQTPAGGGFESDKILPLINEHATTAGITKGLRSFLKQPDRDDIVFFYFACHGAPDPDRPENIYLLTHDTEAGDISGTALPMREIQLALTETLLAERVVMFADTCHSGNLGAGSGRRLATTEAGVMNKYLEELSEARGGVALLTSAEANETSQEGKEWGGGHGVFTHFLLEGMRGYADGYAGRPRDGKVTVRELFEYVRDNVKAATNVQHPVIGPHRFDDSLTIAITGEINAREYCELAERLEKLAQLLGEPQRFRAAAAQFREALDLAQAVGSGVHEAELGYARNLLAAGDLDEAICALQKIIARDKSNTLPHALFFLGIVEVKRHRYDVAVSAFQAFLHTCPQDENAGWVTEYTSWLKTRAGGRKFALVIGINEYQLDRLPRLAGCTNDAKLIKKMLIECGGYDDQNIWQLCDKQATRENILAALAALSAQLNPEDQIWVSYSGHSIPESRRKAFGIPASEDLYLVVHDTIEKADTLTNGISPEELHRALKKLPAQHKTFVLDTHPSLSFIRLVESDGDYTLLLGSDSAELSSETVVEMNGSRQMAGLFTAALVASLSEVDPKLVTYGEVINSTIGYIRCRNFKQTPLLVGDMNRPVFTVEDIYLGAFEFAERRNYTALSPELVKQRYRRIDSKLQATFHEFHYSVGRALTECGAYAAALDPLQKALRQVSGARAKILRTLVLAQLGAYRDDEADSTLRHNFSSESVRTAIAESTLAKMEALLTGNRHALLVGIQQYVGPEVPNVNGAIDDALLMKKILQENWQFRDKDIVVLLDNAATRSAILDHFQSLCAKARKEPALFYYAGNGSIGLDLSPTIVSVDGRCGGVFDIDISELAILARETNLVTILDTGWKFSQTADTEVDPTNVITHGLRTIVPDLSRMPISRGVVDRAREAQTWNFDLQVGALTVCGNGALPFTDWEKKSLELQCLPKTERPPLLTKEAETHGVLTYYLAIALKREWKYNPTYRQCFKAAEEAGYSDIIKTFGDVLDAQLFDNFTVRTAVLKELKLLDDQPRHELIVMLQRLIEQRQRQGSLNPRSWLNLGVAYYTIDNYDKAINALKRSVTLYEDETSLTQEKSGYPLDEEFRCEAYYQLGRIIYQSDRNFTQAVDMLNKALDCDPENPHVLYYLGQAVREMVERETLTKAETVLKKYLEKGAPFGHEDEIRKFLGSRPGPDPWR